VYERLDQFLQAHHASYQILESRGAVSAQEQAAVSHTPGRSFAKVVIVKERDGFVMAVLPASSVLDLDRLKGLIGHGPIRLATVEEIRDVVPDCAPGAIPPFGALYGHRSFVDRILLASPDITMPAGDFGTVIRMSWTEFRRLVGATVGDFAVPEILAPRPPRRATATRRAG